MTPELAKTHTLVSLEEHSYQSYWWVCSCGNEGGPYPSYNAAWDSWIDCSKEERQDHA